MTWQPAEPVTGQNGQINPYEAWDTLGLQKTRDPSTLWQPVYVQLRTDPEGGGFRQAAQRLLILLGVLSPETKTDDATTVPKGSERIFAPDSTVRTLLRLGSDQAVATSGRVFIYRLAHFAYSTVINGDDGIIAKILHVGPVIPGQVEPSTGARSTPVPPDIEPASSSSQVLTAVIDDAIGFLNTRFRATQAQTRIKRFWTMSLERLNVPEQAGVAFGRVLTDQDINAAIDQATRIGEAAVYARFDNDLARQTKGAPLQPDRFRDPSFARPKALVATHGTAVLDLAAGRDPDDTEDGFPPDPIFAVELPQLATADTTGGWLDSYILQAVLQVMDWADTVPTSDEDNEESVTPKPLVINISYGLNAGPKDGSGFLAQQLSDLVQQRNTYAPTWIVLPAGNTFLERGRAQLDLQTGDAEQLGWQIAPDDASPSFLELYFDGTAQLEFNAPGAGSLNLKIDSTTQDIQQCQSHDNKTMMAVFVQPHGSGSRVTWAVAPTRPGASQKGALAPTGEYVLRVQASDGPVRGSVEVQRDDSLSGYTTGARQSTLTLARGDGYPVSLDIGDPQSPLPPLTRQGTLSEFATARSDTILAVGGAGLRSTDNTVVPTAYTSAGTQAINPDVACISEDGHFHSGIIASGLYSGSSVAFGGTSMATALVTRQLVRALRDQVRLTKGEFLSAADPVLHILAVPEEKDQPRLGAIVTGSADPRRVRI